MSDCWNAHLYDDKHSFVSELGKDLITLLSPRTGERILDLGCGTGDLAQQISNFGANVTGIDSSAAMIQQAQQKYPQLTFQVADARNLDYVNQFDAVFSNAALHWIKPPEDALEGIWNALKPGGRLVAEFGGKGNVNSITCAIISAMTDMSVDSNEIDFPWFFPSIGEYAALMEKTGFRVTYALHFNRPTRLDGEEGLRNWINMFGSSLLANIPDKLHGDIIKKAENSVRAVLQHDGVWFADYKRIRVVAIKDIV